MEEETSRPVTGEYRINYYDKYGSLMKQHRRQADSYTAALAAGWAWCDVSVDLENRPTSFSVDRRLFNSLDSEKPSTVEQWGDIHRRGEELKQDSKPVIGQCSEEVAQRLMEESAQLSRDHLPKIQIFPTREQAIESVAGGENQLGRKLSSIQGLQGIILKRLNSLDNKNTLFIAGFWIIIILQGLSIALQIK